MLLAIDIGNTNIVLGIYDGRKLVTHWRLLTQPERTADEYGVLISQLASASGIGCDKVTSIVVSCVVPPMMPMIQELGERLFGVTPLAVGPGVKTGMPILYENPKEVGADRICNGVAAFERYHDCCIAVDFGTATTFDFVTKK
ncbi:MAG TPA: type III pantothenate kinase, partial [Candidatus Binatia bacterium]|nr:type III pantothenate kinase [Candidatus Binatia bacterium]